MACFSLVPGYRTEAGSIVMVERGSIQSNVWLPCGQCIGCRLEKARQWSVRLLHEKQLHAESCFVTLTYSDECLPAGGSLRYVDFQKFLRELRKKRAPKGVRFYMCGEYGEDKRRPHYHAALFGEGFLGDRYFWRMTSGHRSYRSPFLESLWRHGSSEFGDVTQQSAAYMARYMLKKVNGDLAVKHYRWADPETGEVLPHVPEFSHMSLRPGIGAAWFAKFHADVFPRDGVVINGQVGKPPRYYDVLLKRWNPELYAVIKDERMVESGLRAEENSPERLVVRETVARARVAFFRRKL